MSESQSLSVREGSLAAFGPIVCRHRPFRALNTYQTEPVALIDTLNLLLGRAPEIEARAGAATSRSAFDETDPGTLTVPQVGQFAPDLSIFLKLLPVDLRVDELSMEE